jgi:hypothetical protein
MSRTKIVSMILGLGALLIALVACGNDGEATSLSGESTAPEPAIIGSSNTATNPQISPIQAPTGVPSGSPLAPVEILEFDGAEYSVNDVWVVNPDGSRILVGPGINYDVPKLEVVGASYEGQEVYRAVSGDANAVYTFTAVRTIVNPEDGNVHDSPAKWRSWEIRNN